MISFTVLICSFCSAVALAYVISAFQRENNHLDSYVNSMFLHGLSQLCMTDCTVLSLKIKYLKGKRKENKTEKQNPTKSITNSLFSIRGLNTSYSSAM